MKKFEHLTDEELCQKAQLGSEDHREALVARYLRIAKLEARDSKQTLCDEETRTGECLVSLVRAIQTFDPRFGFKFNSYAKRLMRNSMTDMARREARRVSEISIDAFSDEEGESMLERIFAATDDTYDSAAEGFMIAAIETELLKSIDNVSAWRICEALSPEDWSAVIGQMSIFDDATAHKAKVQLLAENVSAFALRVLELRRDGQSFEEVGEILGIGSEVCSLAITWIAGLMAPKSAKKEAVKLTLVQQKPVDSGLFEEAAA